MASSDRDRLDPRLDPIRRQARDAYERAMLRAALPRLWPLAALLPAAYALHGAPTARVIAVALALAVALIATAWRGGGWRRGALPGVLGGLPAFVVPSLAMPAGAACERCVHGSAPWMTCFAACLITSLAAGLALAHLARRDPAPRTFAASAALCAALTAAMTCSLAGGAGLVGVALGLAVSSAPVLVWAPR